jgi:hypothetical protein
MDMNDWAFEMLVRSRVAELHADAECCRRPATARPASHLLRDAVGRAVARMGTRLSRTSQSRKAERVASPEPPSSRSGKDPSAETRNPARRPITRNLDPMALTRER